MLTNTRVSNAKPAEKSYRLPDRRALYLEVKPSGAKIWLYRYRLNGKGQIFTIGRYYDGHHKPPDHISLDEARRRRDEARSLVKQGLNPALERHKQKLERAASAENTFRSVARMWIAENQEHWSHFHAAKVERVLRHDVFPVIGDLPIRDVKAAHVLDILSRIKARKAMTVALEARQIVSAIFRFAIPRHLAEVDHAAPLESVIRRPAVKHKTPMTEDDIKEFVTRIEGQRNKSTTIALKLLLLLFTRPVNVYAAEWSEFHLEAGEWRIPAKKLKMRREHVIPLPRQAVSLLNELKSITGAGRWLFPSARNPEKHMNLTTLNKAMGRMGYGGKFSAHGFRATARTLLTKMGFKPEWIERQLAHAQDRTAAAYDQYQYFTERRDMLQRWANAIDTWQKGIRLVEQERVA